MKYRVFHAFLLVCLLLTAALAGNAPAQAIASVSASGQAAQSGETGAAAGINTIVPASQIIYVPLIICGGGSNLTPDLPSNPMPANGAAAQSQPVTLGWSGGDPNCDAVSYDVYFGTTDPPATQVADHQSGLTYAPGTLAFNVTYYWQVIAWDAYNLSNAGPVWSFTTGLGPGEMVLVPAVTFQMGCDLAHNGGYVCASGELPLHSVYLDAFRIDKTEVTNALYAQCVASGACAAPSSNGSYTRTNYFTDPTYANYPVIYVSWNDAKNYCAWAGKRLPSEAEWEKAARGASDTRTFPWGDQTPTCTSGNITVNGLNCVGDTSAVGSYPAGASPYGALDLIGNVYEWVNDWWDSSYYSISPGSNPPGPTIGTYKVLRGGSWDNGSYSLRLANRDFYNSASRNSATGFRCAAPTP